MIGRNRYEEYGDYDSTGPQAETTAQAREGWLDHMDWYGVREEVQSEVRAEVVLLGLGNVGKSTLFNSLHGWPAMRTALKVGQQPGTVEERMGLFTLIDLPNREDLDEDLLVERLETAALLVYLLDGSVGRTEMGFDEAVIRPADCRWIGRLRATGRPLLVVLNKADLWAGQLTAILGSLERRLGVEVFAVSAYNSAERQRRLLDRMVEACPRLAVPLGREVAAFRRDAASRLIRRAAVLCGLVAMQPVPLIDLPMQIGAQVGLVARISTMYGHPPSSDYSRELLLTGTGSTAVRLLALQVARLVPVLGWVVSGMLAAATTWLLGQSTVAYFEGWDPPESVQDMLADGPIGLVASRFRRGFDSARHFGPFVAAIRRGTSPRRWQPKSRRDAEENLDAAL